MINPVEFAKDCVYSVFDRETLLHIGKSKSEKPRIVFLFVPEYRNYGDVAIAEGARLLINSLPTVKAGLCEVLEVSNVFCMRWPDKLDDLLFDDDILVFTGGGYLGSLWPQLHGCVEDILRRHPVNPLLILPQSIYYEDGATASSFEEAIRTRDRYFICAREHKTLEVCVDILHLNDGKTCGLLPDCAFYLEPRIPQVEGSFAGVCLRSDQESSNSIDYSTCARTLEETLGLRVKALSTVGNLAIPIPSKRANGELGKLLDSFYQYRLVVTDRLHGMILNALCGNCCIALDNTSGKVAGVYESWLKELSFIRILNNAEDFERIIAEVSMVSLSSRRMQLELLLSNLKMNEFGKIVKLLNEMIQNA